MAVASPSTRRSRVGCAPRPNPRVGACARVHQDLVNHRGLRDEGHDPHRAGALRAHERVDLEDLLQQRAHRRETAVGARFGATTIGTGLSAPAGFARRRIPRGRLAYHP